VLIFNFSSLIEFLLTYLMSLYVDFLEIFLSNYFTSISLIVLLILISLNIESKRFSLILFFKLGLNEKDELISLSKSD
jgi:hypothetical protein